MGLYYTNTFFQHSFFIQLTDPHMIDSLHQKLVIDGNFISKILVETWFQRDELGERWEVIHLFWNTEHRFQLGAEICQILHTFPTVLHVHPLPGPQIFWFSSSAVDRTFILLHTRLREGNRNKLTNITWI